MSSKKAQLAEKLKTLSPEQREALLAKLQAKKSNADINISLKDKPLARITRNSDGTYPMSFSQQRLWFLSQFEGPSSAYNIAGGFKLEGNLSAEYLGQSIQHLINSNEILRTSFTETVDGPQQLIHEHIDFTLEVEDINESDIDTRLSSQADIQFDLSAAPLFAMRLFRISDSHHVLSLVIHHIISDGWSNQLLLRQLSSHYSSINVVAAAGEVLNDTIMSSPSIQYLDFSDYHHRLVEEVGAEQLEFWQQALCDNEPLALTQDINADELAPSVSQCLFTLSTNTRAKFESVCIDVGLTPFAAFLSLFQCLLYRYTNQSNFAVGIPASGRIHPDTYECMGFFVNSLPIPCQIDAELKTLSGVALAKSVANFLIQAQSHQDIPFERLVDVVSGPRSVDVAPIFQTFFAYDVEDIELALHIEGVDTTSIPIDLQQKKFDTALTLKNTAEGISGILEFDNAMFSELKMRGLVEHFSACTQFYRRCRAGYFYSKDAK